MYVWLDELAWNVMFSTLTIPPKHELTEMSNLRTRPACVNVLPFEPPGLCEHAGMVFVAVRCVMVEESPRMCLTTPKTKEMTVLHGLAVSVDLYLKRRVMRPRRRDAKSCVTIRGRRKGIRISSVPMSTFPAFTRTVHAFLDVCDHCPSRICIVLHRIVGVQYMIGTKRWGGGDRCTHTPTTHIRVPTEHLDDDSVVDVWGKFLRRGEDAHPGAPGAVWHACRSTPWTSDASS